MARSTVSSKGDLQHIFQSIVQAIARVVNLPVSIWIPDEKKQILRIKASIGLHTEYIHKAFLQLNEPSVTGEAFISGRTIEVHDILDNSRWKYKKEAQEMGWNSVLCVPIKVHKSTIGVISIYSFISRDFSEMEKRLLLDYAAQLELSIEAERMKETLNHLFDLGQKIEQKIAKQPNIVLQEIVNKFGDITGADCVVLYSYDYQRENFYDVNNVATYGVKKKLNPSDKPRGEGGMATYVKREGKVIIEDIERQNPAMLESPFIKRESIRAFMGVALTISSRVLGILYIDFRSPHHFSPDEERAIQLFAHQAAIVINNANLYQHVDSRAKALSKLHKVAPRLVSISPNRRSLKSVLKQIAEDAQSVLGADLVDLYQYDQSEDDFILPPIQLGNRHESFVIKDEIHEDDIVRIVIKKGIQYITNAQEEKSLTRPFKTTRPQSPKERFVVREKLQSIASIPLAVGTEIVGVLFANYRSPQTFSLQQKELIELFADQAAIAIYNSRLYQRARHQSKVLERLQTIGIDLISRTETSKNLSSILKKIAQYAQDVLKADLVDLYQYFEDKDEYNLPPVQLGKRKAPNVMKKSIQKDDVIWSIIKGKQAEFIVNSQANKKLNTPFKEVRRGLPISRFVIREGIQSTAAVPLLVGNEVVGALFANYRLPQSFSDEQRNLIELFASQAAMAIHNSRLYRESLQRLQRLELVRKVAATISTATDVKVILQFAVDGLAKVFDAKQSAVALFDKERECANVLVEYLEPGRISAMGHTIPLKNNPQITKILDTKQALIIDDVQNDPIMVRTRDIMKIRKTASLIVVPIIINDEVIGTIGIDAVEQKRHFTVEEAELAQAIADQAAAALRIAHQLEERLNDIKALQEITEQMHQGDLDAVLNLIAERAVALTGAKHGGVWLVNRTRTALKFGGLANKEQYKKMPPDILLDKNSENSISKWVVLNGKSYMSGNVREDANYKLWYEDTYSELTVPVIYQQRVIGTINVESPNKNSFTEDDRRLLEAMAGQTAIVVQNARLLERLNALDEIGLRLTSDTNLKEDEILESIYTQVKQLTDAQDIYIALYNESSRDIRFPLATQKGKRVEYPTRKANMDKRGKTEEIILTKKPILHKTRKEAEEWYKQPGHEEFVGLVQPSWLGVPIMVGERVLGVIAIYDLDQEFAYDEHDLEVFSSMASQTAFALVNQELNRRNAALASLNTIDNTLTSGLRLNEERILDLIFAQAQVLTGAQDLYIALYNEVSGEIRFPRATEKGKLVTYASRLANSKRRGKTDEIIFTRKPILHKTLKESEEWYSQYGHAEFIGHISPSWLGVPMIVGERVIGVIAAVDNKDFAYDELHLEVLSSMASQAAIALDNARLYQEARGEVIAAKQVATLGVAIAALEHRINNTLNIITPNITRLRSRVNIKDRTIREILDIIERNTRYTSDILMRIQTPLQHVESSNINLNSILNDVATAAKKEWAKKVPNSRIRVTLDLDDSIPLLYLSLGQISEIVRNLIDNSYRAMKRGGKLTISSRLQDNTILIRIKDTAKGGIPPIIQKRLFQKPVPSKEPGQGAGLGLWLSRLMLQGVGGDVTIEKTGSAGTTMLLQIPLTESREEAAV